MKMILLFTTLLIFSIPGYTQPGGDFPPGEEYNYRVLPLDTLSNPVEAEMYYRRDLFSEIADYKNKLANIFLTKTALTEDSLDIKPYSDSLFFYYDGTDGYEYFQTRPLEGLLMSLDSLNLDPNFSFLDFFRSLQAWYSQYRFSAPLNDEYTLSSIDTTVAGFNARLEYTGERFADETIPTRNAGYAVDCKKFLISWKVKVFVIIGWNEILTMKDTVWIDPGEEFWKVQDVTPTNYIDLSLLGFQSFYVYGSKTYYPFLVDVKDEVKIPTEITLSQNYPNPFNPSTTIKFSVKGSGHTTLKIYNLIGEQVAELINADLSTGSYKVDWNAAAVPSGVYFYRLKNGGFIETKKMILIK